ncbi:hypothetical protein [Amycolatopsis anabasis]|uniref:hypothetical protein n=1 Tax=Amycolatopsis anabasis TaxID=1840409 RepID=UPI00131B0240|nr:hypothetical protein [Amycolatopsis anabasis]
MFLAQQVKPAGGAAFDQIAIVAGFTTLVFAAIAYVIWREGLGHRTIVGKLADALAVAAGVPRWVALPALVHLASIASAGVGVYWDVSIHFDLGRDEGPLANPAHYFMFAGLLGFLAAGGFSLALADKRRPRRTFRLGRAWRVPYGAALITLSAFFAFAAFPMDDVWHRIFGQDVTLWGPTHILLMGGALFSFVGAWLLAAEARQVTGENRWLRGYEFGAALATLLCACLYTMEYDDGASQFPLLNHPALLAFCAAAVLAGVRARFGRGSTLLAVAIFAALRAVLALIVAGGFGLSLPHFPLLIAEALLIEGAALALSPERRRLAFGALSGFLIGTIGVLAEYVWQGVFSAVPWPANLLAWALPVAAVTGTAGGVLSAWLSARLDDIARDEPVRVPSLPGGRIAAVAVGVVAVVLGLTIPPTADTRAGGTLALEDVKSGPRREAVITVRTAPGDVAEGAIWFDALAWQGGGLIRVPMNPAGDGTYRSAGSLPVHGEWKTVVRLHHAPKDLVALAVHFPADPAIGAPGVPAVSGVTRDFVEEKKLLRPEEKDGVPGWLWTSGYLVVGLVFLAMIGSSGVALTRASGGTARTSALTG